MNLKALLGLWTTYFLIQTSIQCSEATTRHQGSCKNNHLVGDCCSLCDTSAQSWALPSYDLSLKMCNTEPSGHTKDEIFAHISKFCQKH